MLGTDLYAWHRVIIPSSKSIALLRPTAETRIMRRSSRREREEGRSMEMLLIGPRPRSRGRTTH